MASRTTFWPDALGGPEDGKLFSFKTCEYYLYLDANRQTKKIIAFTDDPNKDKRKPASFTKTGVGYELDLAPCGDRTSHFFILDIDYHSKSSQRGEIRSNAALIEFLSEQDDLYTEYSVNGGVHVLFNCTEKIFISDAMSKCPLMTTASERHGVVFEFKHKCLVYPSANYAPFVSLPKTPLARHSYDVIHTILNCIQECFPSTRPVEWANHLGLQRLPVSSSATTNYSLSDLMQNENEHDDDDDEHVTIDVRMQKVSLIILHG